MSGGGLSVVQRIARAILPTRAFAAMETESRRWIMECPNCGHSRSIWELGGIRYKASGTPKQRARCSRCGQTGWFPIRLAGE